MSRPPFKPESVEARVLRFLEDSRTPYRLIEIDPAYADTLPFCERYDYPLDRSVNCILVASKTGEKKYTASLVQATRRLNVNHTVRRLMGVRKLSFASADETIERTGMEPGGVTPFALPADIPVYVDAPIVELGEIILGGGGRTTKLIVATSAFRGLPNAQVVEDLGMAPGG